MGVLLQFNLNYFLNNTHRHTHTPHHTLSKCSLMCMATLQQCVVILCVCRCEETIDGWTDIVSQIPPQFPSFLLLYDLAGSCFFPLQLVNVCVTVAGLGFAAMYHMSHYYLICSVRIHSDPLGISTAWCNMMWHCEVRICAVLYFVGVYPRYVVSM